MQEQEAEEAVGRAILRWVRTQVQDPMHDKPRVRKLVGDLAVQMVQKDAQAKGTAISMAIRALVKNPNRESVPNEDTINKLRELLELSRWKGRVHEIVSEPEKKARRVAELALRRAAAAARKQATAERKKNRDAEQRDALLRAPRLHTGRGGDRKSLKALNRAAKRAAAHAAKGAAGGED